MAALYNFLIGLKILTDNLVSRLRKAKIIQFKQYKDKDNFLLPSETKTFIRHIRALLTITPESDYYFLQNLNLLYLLLIIGLRAKETKTILWDNIHLEGTELNPEPYIVLERQDRKQKEPFAIAITPEIKKVIDFHLQLIGQYAVNLGDFDLETETIKPKAKPKYLFISADDMRIINLSKERKKLDARLKKKGKRIPTRTFDNKPCSRIRKGFAILKEKLGELENGGKLSANTLRHTFTTFGNLLGYTDVELDSITGHISQSGKTATQVYVARVVKDNRQAFLHIQEAMLCNDVEDRHFKRRDDSIGKRLNKATTEELIGYYNQGILTKEEEKKYHIHKLLKEMYKKQLGYGANAGGAEYWLSSSITNSVLTDSNLWYCFIMTGIYLLTILWLKEPNIYHNSSVFMSYKNLNRCLKELNDFELDYGRKEGQYVIENYSKINDAGTKYGLFSSLYELSNVHCNVYL